MKTKLLFLAAAAFLAPTSLALSQQAQFTKITTGAIVNDLGSFTRGAWGDFSHTGYLDLFVANWNNLTNVFYRNNGDGTFTKVIQGDPVQDADYHTGAAAADYENNGYLDLIVSAGDSVSVTRRNMLYHNNGDGTFSRVSGGGITNQLGNFDACAWADYDHDGFVDLFITDNGPSQSGARNELWHNNGDGTFTRITAGAVVNDVGVGWAALWADYDNDGYMDLTVINLLDNARTFLYHNNRDGTFTRILTNTIATDLWPGGAQCGAWGDYDNDGLLDLFVTDNGGVRNRLYHNNGNGVFTNVSSGPMLLPPAGGYSGGCTWGDYDNDGYLDLFVANGGGRNGLYHNNGDGTFTQILSESLVNESDCSGVAWVDYDNDGFLDLFLARNQGLPLVPNALYHNNGNTNSWLEVKLVGTASNRSAIGAKVRVRATIGGKTFWQLREINTGGGWNLVPLVAHFGLGNATNVETLRIEWPSGTPQEFQNVRPRQLLTITEPPRLLANLTNGVPQFALKAWPGMQFAIQSSTDLAAWSPVATITITNRNGRAEIMDTNPPALDRRFYRAVSP